MFLYVETFFNVCTNQRCLWRTHVLNFLSNTNTAVATAESVRMDGHDNTAANRLHISLASNCVRDKLFSPARYSSGHQEPAR